MCAWPQPLSNLALLCRRRAPLRLLQGQHHHQLHRLRRRALHRRRHHQRFALLMRILCLPSEASAYGRTVRTAYRCQDLRVSTATILTRAILDTLGTSLRVITTVPVVHRRARLQSQAFVSGRMGQVALLSRLAHLPIVIPLSREGSGCACQAGNLCLFEQFKQGCGITACTWHVSLADLFYFRPTTVFS